MTRPARPSQLDQPIKKALELTEPIWKVPTTRVAVLENFQKVIACRTAALGSEVYASADEHRVVHHTCKSRTCPSCGYRATLEWQRQLQAALPDIPFAAIVLTMPHWLWPLYRENRHLLADLPLLGGAVLQQWAEEAHGVEIMGISIRHTFGRHLDFKPHLHILVSAAGWNRREGRWVPSLEFDNDALMKRWRYAIVTQLRTALMERQLTSDWEERALKQMLSNQYIRQWVTHVAPSIPKEYFIRYAGRYVKRPPIAQHRFARVSRDKITFRTIDMKQKRPVMTEYRPEQFIQLLSDYVPDRYRHTLRYFGLLAPRSRTKNLAAIFAILRQQPASRPEREPWAALYLRSFGVNPLLDRQGRSMQWLARRSSLT